MMKERRVISIYVMTSRWQWADDAKTDDATLLWRCTLVKCACAD